MKLGFSDTISFAAQIHFWPWSADIPEETVDLLGPVKSEFVFLGSPVISLPEDTAVYLPMRNDGLRSLGAKFFAGPAALQYRLFEGPHGFFTTGKQERCLRLKWKGQNLKVPYRSTGAKGRDEVTENILSEWLSVFDRLIEKNKGRRAVVGVDWCDVWSSLSGDFQYKNEIRRSLIVTIAEKLGPILNSTVKHARRILLRERDLIKLHRIREMDRSALTWVAQQAGDSLAEKAGIKQQMPAIRRFESFDTLENRIVRDFAKRCVKSAIKYEKVALAMGAGSTRSPRAVHRYRSLCRELISGEVLGRVSDTAPVLQPNYVLQKDRRYRTIWTWYKKLLKQDLDADSIWDWQSRLWADVARIHVGCAFEELKSFDDRGKGLSLHLRSAKESTLQLSTEHFTGARIQSSSIPGPFFFQMQSKEGTSKRYALEMVHSDDAHKHEIVQRSGISRLGGHIYLIVHRIEEKPTPELPRIVVIWGINSIGSATKVDDKKVCNSAQRALGNYIGSTMQRSLTFPAVYGLVLTNTLLNPLEGCKCTISEGAKSDIRSQVMVLELSQQPSMWPRNITDLSENLFFLLELMLSDE